MIFPPAILQEIKDRLSIVGLIGEYVQLKKAGRNHKGLCPFHQEKSPSFMVNDEKQLFHCFGCGEGGDLLHFIMKREGLNFPEAVRQLAERAGVVLPTAEDPVAAAAVQAEDRTRRLLLRVNQLALEYFQQTLVAGRIGSPVKAYLNSRGFAEPAFWTQHFLGAAEEEWEGVTHFLQSRRVPMELAMQAGLVRRRNQGAGYYDFFRRRLIFPIRGMKGEVVSFGGRVLPDGAADEGAKYLNGSDSPVFHKGKTLYGLPMALAAMRTHDRAIVVEGYLDVLALHLAGLEETIAPLGTALTADHLRLIMRATRNVWFAYDGDAAGRQAAQRSLLLCLDVGLIPRMVRLPDGDDPDTVMRREGREAFVARLDAAPTVFEWLIDDLVVLAGTDTIGRVRAVDALRPYFARLRDAVQEAVYMERVARAVGIEGSVVQRALRSGTAVLPSPVHARERTLVDATRPLPLVERRCLEFLLQVPAGMGPIVRELSPQDFQHPTARRIATHLWTAYEADGELRVGSVLARETDEAVRRVVAELALTEGQYEDSGPSHELASQLAGAMRRTQHQETCEQLNAAIAAAERGAQGEVLERLLLEKQTLLQARHKGVAGGW
ncbi:MAG: DNA primase [Deltaproteobacteria bacterium]|nr:DNA primase [Deltaproteobacteria bacterium]